MKYSYTSAAQQYTRDYIGLTDEEVKISKQRHGENRISKKTRKGFMRSFFESFGDPMIKVLLAALAINIIFLSSNANWFESAGIALAILLATLVSAISEYGSESAFERLQEEAARIQSRVQRSDGLKELPIEEIVVGDLVLLQAGDRIPADGYMIKGQIEVDQSALNGESKEIKKFPEPQTDNTAKDGFLSPCKVFAGSIVCAGEGLMQVSRVGDKTFYGRIGVEIQEETRESPLRYRLKALAKNIGRFGYIAAIISAFVFLFNFVIIDNNFDSELILKMVTTWDVIFPLLLQACTLAVTVVVMAVPEGLPMMITVVLSANMKRMLKNNVLVRKLIGIETAGSVNILFTDKTGTLTVGRLEVELFISGSGKVWDGEMLYRDDSPLSGILKDTLTYNSAATLNHDGTAIGGNATDRAALEFAAKLKGGRSNLQSSIILPFTSENKMMLSAVKGGWDVMLVKGAPERLLPLCTQYYNEAGHLNLFIDHSKVERLMHYFAQKAMRIIAVAVAEPGKAPLHNLKLIGLLAIRDRMRPEALKAITQVQAAGIQTVMITGDSRTTAIAIAREAKLLQSAEQVVLTSEEMNRLSDKELSHLLPQLRVVARALPTDKSRLVRVAQDMGLVVGMTGDGVNDAPALKKADIGFAMGSGTEVAKEAGDIVILDNNFSSIAKAICYGRTIFKSIRKFIIYQVSICLSAVGVTVAGPLIHVDFPITVIQMLWINVVMDTLAGLAFSGEQARAEYMTEPPKKRNESIVNRYMLAQISVTSIYTIAICLAFLRSSFYSRMAQVHGEIYSMTAFFALFMFCAIFISFNARTHRLNLLHGLASNASFIWIMSIVTIVQVLILYFGGRLYRTVPMSFDDLFTIALIAFSVIPVDFIRKSLCRDFSGT